MAAFTTHLSYALRTLRRSPAVAITAVVTLALGIGATTAIFSVANAVLLRTLPYPDADRLMLVWGELRARDVKDFPSGPGDFADLRTEVTHFEEIGALIPVQQPLRTDEYDPEQLPVALVTSNLLSMLGAQVAGDAASFRKTRRRSLSQRTGFAPRAPLRRRPARRRCRRW
jgi:hypothetical protein